MLGGAKRERREEAARSKERRGDDWNAPAVLPPSPFYLFPRLRKERIADVAREAVKIFFENKDTVSWVILGRRNNRKRIQSKSPEYD